ncbi:Uncharacterised protein [Bordetella pertussis]|nr:Uncharacterised protein [Bordetella pertussis]CFO66999.1 Uncharacterised protein [Bordetella pertussis]CPH75475.1 Uncharacterised protein [Bordetella pertussis]CPK49079.1 Uncharacterised protein [Bordetella pertussis]CPK88845.1 Uncharacterised protein [Bordetella pertussis]
MSCQQLETLIQVQLEHLDSGGESVRREAFFLRGAHLTLKVAIDLLLCLQLLTHTRAGSKALQQIVVAVLVRRKRGLCRRLQRLQLYNLLLQLDLIRQTGIALQLLTIGRLIGQDALLVCR